MKLPQNVLEYFLVKLRGYDLRRLVFLEFEAYLAWPVRGLPSFLGFILRFLVYKFLFKELSSFCFIQPNVYFSHCYNIRCGKNFIVNSNSYFHGIGGIDIGDYVLIGPNVVISSGMHSYTDPKLPVAVQEVIPKKITIGDGVWIGANVVIMPGTTLGKGTVVGAGSVVTKSTEPYSVVVGVPARKIKSRSI